MKLFLIGFFSILLNVTLYSQNIATTSVISTKFNNYKLNTYVTTFKLNDTISEKTIKRTFFDCGQIKSENKFDSSICKKFQGKQTKWYKNGVIQSEINYSHGKKDGSFKTFWENGNIKREDHYKKGKFIKGTCWNILGKKINYYSFNIQPKFIGGMNGLATYFKKNIQYPKNSQSSSTSNKVVVCALITSSGKIMGAKIIKGVNKILNKEAKRVVMSMPNWSPAFKDGVAIRSEISMPILFIRN